MKGRVASCTECLDLGLADCTACPKPDGLDRANEKALDCWAVAMHGEKLPETMLQIIAPMGVTDDDLEKLLTISQIYRELNPDDRQQQT